jgi:hypothetical protein
VSKVAGVDPDLVVRAMGWKGDATLIRTITAGASFRAMGMQSEEFCWKIRGRQHARLRRRRCRA